MTADDRIRRLHERFGERIIWVYMAIALTNAMFAVGIDIAIAQEYVDVGASRFVIVTLVGLGLGSVCVAIVTQLARQWVLPAFRWMASEKTPVIAATAWLAANRGVDRTVFYGLAVFSAAYVPFGAWAGRALEIPWGQIPTVCAFVQIGTTFAATLDYFAFRRLLRPVIRDAADYLDADFHPRYRSPSLRVRLLTVMFIVSALVGLLTSSLNDESRGTSSIPIALGIVLLVVLVVGLPPVFFVAEDLGLSIRDVMRSARSAEAGDLSARVPLRGADEGGVLARQFNRMMRGLEEREALRLAMGSYVDPMVATRVLSEGELLAGEEVTGTVMFVDIRGFTAWCDGRTAQEAVALLNAFFGAVVPCIAEHGGHANKFLGDGLLAGFGTPDTYADHADRALAAAHAVARAVEECFEGTVRIGIGLHTGPLIVGTLGGGGRLEFGLIGDVVNVASRIEQLTKETGDVILASETTVYALHDSTYVGAVRGQLEVRGKSEPIVVYGFSPVRESPIGQS